LIAIRSNYYSSSPRSLFSRLLHVRAKLVRLDQKAPQEHRELLARRVMQGHLVIPAQLAQPVRADLPEPLDLPDQLVQQVQLDRLGLLALPVLPAPRANRAPQ
jgi:hypothetical protein